MQLAIHALALPDQSSYSTNLKYIHVAIFMYYVYPYKDRNGRYMRSLCCWALKWRHAVNIKFNIIIMLVLHHSSVIVSALILYKSMTH